ncbi:MAG TPA: YdcF family protein [Methylotenera sp.]|nr:YdcF family protein [Methylotenera sp.]HPH05035.1 YdcF family protein [Methylotenera sp.]HPN00297.1 YdcF family protein [Methylotenera sp.]
MHKLAQLLRPFVVMFQLTGKIFALKFLPRWLRLIVRTGFVLGIATYGVLYCIIAIHAYQFLANPPTQKADAALILGNRAYLNGAPNPCLTGRVDEGVRLAKQDLVKTLVMSGGVDVEDGRIEAVTMEAHAKKIGFNGAILLESRSSSTQENFAFSRPILESIHARNVIVISEPYHLWRVQKLVEAGHLGQDFTVSYAAAPSFCWTKWGMGFKGALREPLAIINNYAKGYY